MDSRVWDVVDRVVEAEGLRLFDVDEPSAQAGGNAVLRVYITLGEGSQAQTTDGEGRGVSFDDCARVSRRLVDLDEQEPFIPEGCLLEVSSPGINRRLRRPEHFAGAVGERVKVKYRASDDRGQSVTGVLRTISGGVLEIESSEGGAQVAVPLDRVREARVDFVFESGKK